MKPGPFRYAAPDSMPAALELLAAEDARPLAGGQSLVPMLNFRLAWPDLLVDLNPLAELSGIEVGGDGALRLGAMTRQATLQRSAAVAEGWPLLTEAVSHVGHAAIRSRGTVGGSVAHADPAAELPVALTALDARFRVRSGAGERVLSPTDFFEGALTTALAPGKRSRVLRGEQLERGRHGVRGGITEGARLHRRPLPAATGIVWSARHSLSAVNGGATTCPPRASATALATAASAPTAPPSPAPLAPSGFSGDGVCTSAVTMGGISAAVSRP